MVKTLLRAHQAYCEVDVQLFGFFNKQKLCIRSR